MDWEDIFTSDFLRIIEAETCHEMFCNFEGIMLADGLVWIAEVSVEGEYGSDNMLKVITLYV